MQEYPTQTEHPETPTESSELHTEEATPQSLGFNDRSSEAIARYKDTHPDLYQALLEAGPDDAHELLAEHAQSLVSEHDGTDAAYIAYGKAADTHYHLKAQATQAERQAAQDSYRRNVTESEAAFQQDFSAAARSIVADDPQAEKAA